MKITAMRYLLILILCCFAASSCKKDKMPEPSQEGKNILACKVNSDVHVYEGKRSYLNPNGVSATRVSFGNEYFIRIAADKTEDYNDNIDMRVVVYQPELNKEYIFSKEDSKDWAQYYVGQNGANMYYTKNSSGYIKFTRFDKSAVAGTFMFTAYNDQDEKVEITKGFFDIIPEGL